MPTTLPRTNITHVPRVEKILRAGRSRWPDRSDREIIIELAEERAAELTTGRYMPSASEQPVTLGQLKSALAEINLDDEWLTDIAETLKFAREADPWGDD